MCEDKTEIQLTAQKIHVDDEEKEKKKNEKFRDAFHKIF